MLVRVRGAARSSLVGSDAAAACAGAGRSV